jgi:DNA-binding transcriptional LysR family regulator
MHLDPVRLLVLRAVRRAGGVLPAARLLQVTPSGISQHLRRLEMETGLVLSIGLIVAAGDPFN